MAKQHEFRLEQVLKFRKEVERLHQLELAQAKLEHDSAQDRLKNEKSALEELARELGERQRQGIDARELQLYGAFNTRKQKEIRGITESVQDLEKLVQQKRDALVVAAKEKKALEVFKEKQMKQKRLEQLLKERDFMDELAVQGRGQK